MCDLTVFYQMDNYYILFYNEHDRGLVNDQGVRTECLCGFDYTSPLFYLLISNFLQ